jgi:hypothetical protein
MYRSSDLEENVSRFLLAVIRNCGVAIAISVFFAAARGPAHPRPPGGVDTFAAAELTAPTPKTPGCDQPAARVCRLVDAGR